MNALEIKNLNYSYHEISGETKALHDINLTIEKGSFISIVGPSGCGKSTLLSLIAGIYTQKPELFLSTRKPDQSVLTTWVICFSTIIFLNGEQYTVM